MMTMKRSKKREIVWQKDKGTCWICGRAIALAEMTLDHDIPRSKGGKGDVSNLRAAHGKCNSDRGNGDPRQQKKPKIFKPKLHGPRPRGPVMAHITNENAATFLTTDDKISLQKRDES